MPAAILAALIAACDTSDDPPCLDGGPRWTSVDSQIPPRPDGAAAPDSGETRVCFPIDPLPDTDMPRCEAETRDCVAGCASATDPDTCRGECFMADTRAPLVRADSIVACGDCVNTQVLSCIDTNGCHAEVAAFLCCIVDNCVSGGPTCIDDMCSTYAQAMFVCGAAAAPECFDLTAGMAGQCYAAAEPTPDGGVPTPDAGGAE